MFSYLPTVRGGPQSEEDWPGGQGAMGMWWAWGGEGEGGVGKGRVSKGREEGNSEAE